MADLHITSKKSSKKAYTAEELSIIKNNYPHNLDLIVELLPNRNRKSIILKAYCMGLSSGKNELWKPNEDTVIREFYPVKGAKYVADNLLPNRDYKSIQQRAHKLGVSFLTYNSQYFNIIDSHEKAYWIGFLMADGYVNSTDNRFGMELQQGDIHHIEKFLVCIGSNQKVRTRTRYPKDGNAFIKIPTHSCSILLNNKMMHDDLIKAGVIPNKSLAIKLPEENFVDKYFFDILRGLIDGDGTIGLYKTGNGFMKPSISLVSASKELMTAIQQRLKCYNIYISLTKRETEGRETMYKLRTEKQSTCFDLLYHLYKDSTENSKLDRKYASSLEISNYYSQYGLV